MKLSTSWKDFDYSAILDLYRSVNWTVYSDNPENLKLALENSTSVVVALHEGEVIGLARSVSDQVSIHYIQDILVHPAYQGKGIGGKLMAFMLEQYKNVRTHMLLTDDEERQKQFYQSRGFSNVKSLKKTNLNSYVKIKDQELS